MSTMLLVKISDEPDSNRRVHGMGLYHNPLSKALAISTQVNSKDGVSARRRRDPGARIAARKGNSDARVLPAFAQRAGERAQSAVEPGAGGVLRRRHRR